jgi:hypothetical protein
MVWARTKLMIHDDLLKPLPRMTIKFSGPNPEKFYKEIYNLIIMSFRVPEHAIQERDFNWSKGDPEKFSARWEVNKDLDKFSYYWIDVILRGEMSKGHGKADITVEGALRTEYPQDTFWQKSLFYEFLRMTWHTFFYASKRDEYMREGRRMLSFFLDQLKAMSRV